MSRRWTALGTVLVFLLGATGCKEELEGEEWPDPVSFRIAIDCGSDGEGDDGDEGDDEGGDGEDGREDGGDSPFVVDVPYSGGLGYGYEGGEPSSAWFPWVVGATPYTAAYLVRRDGATAYRVDVPQAGPYVVTMGFSERDAHGPGFRIQDVTAEGSLIVGDLDVFAVAGQDLAWTVRREVVVTDGVLDLTFDADGGHPTSLATLAVERANPDDVGPAPPEEVRGSGSYDAVVLRWTPVVGDPGLGWDSSVPDLPDDEDISPFGDVIGYQLERKPVGEGQFSTLFGGTVPVPFYVDHSAEIGQRYEYRVRAVDVWGNLSDASTVATGEARWIADSPIPVYEIEIADEDLRTLQADPWGEEEVDLTLWVDEVAYPGDGRFRGASTRGLAKKSWRVELDDPLPDGRHKLDLKAEWGDWSQLQELLSYDLFWAEGDGDPAQVQGGRAAPVQLVINGVYDGLRLDVERIDGDFLAGSGRDPDGDLFRGGGFGELLGGATDYEEAYRRRAGTGDIEHLIGLLEFHARAHRDEFGAELEQVMDGDALVDLLAIDALLGRPETEANDYFYYRDSGTGLWEVLTWDNNNGNFGLGLFWPSCEPWAAPVHMSLQYAESAGMTWWHVLRTRVLNQGDLRESLQARIEDLLGAQYLTQTFKQQIHARFDELRDEVRGDPYKYPWAEPALFDGAEDILEEAVDLRAGHLSEALAGMGALGESALVINEFGVYPCAEGEEPCEPYGFVELFNRGPEAVEFAGIHLTGDLRDPLATELPEGELAPGEYRVLEAGPAGDMYPIDVAGGELGLFRVGEGEGDEGEGFEVLDLWWYGRLTGGVSYGRTADGEDEFAFLLESSEGTANGGTTTTSPRVGVPLATADSPQPGEPLSLTVRIEHPTGIAEASCHWRAAAGAGTVPLSDDGQHGDGEAGDGVYGATVEDVPADATQVDLWIEAVSTEGVRQVYPRTAPGRWRIVALGGD